MILFNRYLTQSVRFFIFALLILLLSYLLYVHPVFLISYLIFDFKTSLFYLIIPSLIITCVTLIYLKTHFTNSLIRSFIHNGMGLGFIGFWVFNIGLLFSIFQKDYKYEIGCSSFFVFFLLSLHGLIQGRLIKLKVLKFESAKINAAAKFLFLSDVHLGSNPRSHLEKICTTIEKLDFDFLLIGGDLFDSSSFNSKDLIPLKRIKSPIYFVTGNHEYYVKDYQIKLQALPMQNISILDNESIILGEINLIGISDNQSPERQFLLAQSMIKKNLFNLLLVHKPSVWEKAREFTDLMLSGHTHNGQIFPFNFLVRMQFKTVYGLFKEKQSRLFVSSGSGTWGPRMRIGTNNEILQVEISPNFEKN